jgi:GntR family transcriptional regulator
MLYPNVSKPLYEQLKQELRENIRSGLYKPDETLPGERRLMEIYKVSRMTVRQAIGDLVSEGFLYRRHGSGTFVAERVIDRPMVKLYGLAEELILSRKDLSVKLINAGLKSPTPQAKHELQLTDDEKSFSYTRLYSSKGKPILLTNANVTQSISKLLANVDIAKDVIYEHLEKCGYQIDFAVQSMQAGNPTPEEARYMGCPKNIPVLVVNRTTYIKGGYPIMYTRALYSQEYVFTINLKR